MGKVLPTQGDSFFCVSDARQRGPQVAFAAFANSSARPQRTPRSEYVPGGLVATALEPIVTAITGTVHEILSEIPAGLAEDVVRGKIRLAGGGALLPGLAGRIETAAGIGAVLVDDPLRCVVRGAAEMLERKDSGKDEQSGPGLRQ